MRPLRFNHPFHAVKPLYIYIFVETGWPITAHAVGLGDVAAEHLQTTGRPVPGYHGISELFFDFSLRSR